MKNDKYLKRTIHIAWPCIFENIMITFVTFVNTIMVGSLGAAATAAVGINSAPVWLLNSLPMVFSVSGTALVARYVGANDRKKANDIACQIISMSMVAGLVVMLTMIVLSNYIPAWMGGEPEILPQATAYLKIYSFSVGVQFCGLVAAGILRGSGNTKAPMFATLFMNLINIIGNFLLINPVRDVTFLGLTFKMWGAGMGVTGAATSTCFAQILSGMIILVLLFRRSDLVYVDWRKLFKFDKATVKRALVIGIPAAGERVSVNLGQLVFQWMVATLGTVQVAAHFLANTAEAIAYMPGFGFQVAATTLVGQSLGAEEKEEAIIYSKICIKLTLISVLCASFVFFFFPTQLLSIFSNDKEVIEMGAGAIRIVSFSEPFFCLTLVLIGILRGAGDTLVPFFTALAGMWIVRLSVAAVLIFVLKMDLYGAWLAMGADMIARSIFLFPRYKKKKWLNLS